MDPLALEPTPADPYPPEGSIDQVEDVLAYLDTMHQRYKLLISGFTSWGIGMDAEATEAFGDWRQRLIEDGIAPPTDQS